MSHARAYLTGLGDYDFQPEISRLNARAYALRTATPAQVAQRRASLGQALDAASGVLNAHRGESGSDGLRQAILAAREIYAHGPGGRGARPEAAPRAPAAGQVPTDPAQLASLIQRFTHQIATAGSNTAQATRAAGLLAPLLTQAMVLMGSGAVPAALNTAVQAAQQALGQARVAGGPRAPAGGGGGGGAGGGGGGKGQRDASEAGEAAAPRAARGGQRRNRAARRERAAETPAYAPELEAPSPLPPASVGLIEALAQSPSAMFDPQPGSFTGLWFPPNVGFFGSPMTKLLAATGVLAGGTALVWYWVTESWQVPARLSARVPPRVARPAE